ncbi:fimbrial protein [Klebsiella oxytoca]|uniref:fimbrial protein n=1 Tax=Klebsiella oxytoca TaxID=571 RepID=UPI00157A8933|nr:fimbrial protein [Klebsiella oxytoca]
MSRSIKPGWALGLLLTLGYVLPAQAVNVKFLGTLVVPPPCVINSGNDIAVKFDNDMLVGRLNGTNYEKNIPYTLNCTGATSAALRMQFQGAGAGFDASVLGTSKAGLGLQLRSGGVKLPVNTWLSFTNPARPVLSVVPVRAVSGTLAGGAFTATSTLVVDYQ